jgi:HK97 family phage portal protein
MGLFSNIRNALSIPGDSLSSPSGWLTRLLALSETSAGIAINEYNALTVADVWKCDRVIRETIAMLPWKVYQHQPRGRKELKSHPLYFLLHDEPNPNMSSFTFREMLVSNLNLWGKHFSYIERNKNGQVVGLWPIRPDLCRFQIVDGVMWFFARTLQGAEMKYWDDEIFYVPGLTRDGIHSYSPIALHRETLGLSKATEIFGAKFFGNGLHQGGNISHPGNISKEAAARLKEQFEERHSGLENAHRLMVLEEGMKFETNTVPPEDAQFLQTRQFQRADVAGLFRVPPHKIGDLSRATFSNIEHQDLEFLRDCIAPTLERIEQAGNRRLLLPGEKGKIYIEFEIKGMLRGDTAARAAWYQARFNTASMSPNDIKEAENEEIVDGGDEYFVPMNMVPLSQIGKVHADDPPPDPGDDPLAKVRESNLRFFRDVTGRVAKRKPAERQKYAQSAFLQPVLNVIQCLLGSVSTAMGLFAQAHVATIGAISAGWEPERADEIAAEVLDLCMKEVLARGKN